MTVTLQQLESRLWDAANALRGPVDPADFKTYVFPMLFWKWISDTWEYEHAEAVTEYGGDLTAEYETIAAAAQRDRWATLIRSCGLTPEQAESAIESQAFGAVPRIDLQTHLWESSRAIGLKMANSSR